MEMEETAFTESLIDYWEKQQEIAIVCNDTLPNEVKRLMLEWEELEEKDKGE